MECIALRSGESQIRRYPHRRGRYNTSGYENFVALNFPAEAERCGKEAVQLLDAGKLSEHKTDLIIKNDQIVIQVHESSGHPTELDRVLGTEADSAGTSFLTPDGLGKFRYGSEVVNIVADATVPKGLGTFGYDDDGIPAKRTDLVKEGMHVGYTSSRETAAELGLKTSSGNSRAQFAYSLPMVRMTNINLLPGDWKSEEIVEDTKKGVLMVCNKSHSIDDRRLNFQFGTEIGWEIKNGSLERMVKNCIYTGITPEFWGSCDAISKDDWHMDGTTGCGKGSPGQSTYVGHGVSTARFRGTRVWSE